MSFPRMSKADLVEDPVFAMSSKATMKGKIVYLSTGPVLLVACRTEQL